MGALTDNRKRLFADHRLNSSYYSIVDLSSDPETPPSKKLKPLPSPPTPATAPLPSELRRPSPAAGIVQYPPVTPLPRPVHGPQRTLRVFGLGSSNDSRRSAIDDEISGELERYKKMVVDLQSRSAEKPPVELRLSPPSLGSLPVVDLADVAQRPAEEASDMCILDQMAEDDDVKVVEESTPPVTETMEREWEEYKRSYEESLRKSDSVLRKLELEIKLAERKMFGFHLVDEALRKKPKEDLLEPFAPLSKEDEDDVCHALQGGRRYEVLVTHEASNIEITREILQCLSCGAWLNDEVINLYLELLKERERREPKKFLKCHFFNTFFYKKLISGRGGYDFKAVRRWTTQKKIGYGLIECDKIFVPIHKEIHWCLAVIDVKHKKFQFLDSLGGLDTMVLRILGRYFMDEVRDKSEKQIDTKSWKLEGVDDLPLQENGSDCGMFMLKYTDFYSRGLSLSFRQEHMPYFRKRTAKEILRLRVE